MNLDRCPTCRGTSQNPEGPAVIADDTGTCLTCCNPLDPRYAAHHGYILPEDHDRAEHARGRSLRA